METNEASLQRCGMVAQSATQPKDILVFERSGTGFSLIGGIGRVAKWAERGRHAADQRMYADKRRRLRARNRRAADALSRVEKAA